MQAWHSYPPKLGYTPRLGDEVFIRPRTAKELGLTGRLSEFVRNQHDDDDGNNPSSNTNTTKKRKREEPTRAVVSIQPASDEDGCTSARRTVTSRPSRLVKVYAAPSSPSSSSSSSSRDYSGASEKPQPQPQHIVVTSDTVNYRILAASQVKSEDFVVEIGCSTGECTAVLARYASSVVAFDTGESMIAAAKERVSSVLVENKRRENDVVSYHKIDALQDPRGALKAIESSTSGKSAFPDAVYIDIGGNRAINGVVRMMDWVIKAFRSHPPRLIVVKSQELVRELQTASRSNTILLNIDDKEGSIHYGQDWFSLLAESLVDDDKGTRSQEIGGRSNDASGPPKFSHPLKAPLALSPHDDATPICRFHNYHTEGCKKGDMCDFDHSYCHYCLKKGHTARECGESRY